MGQEFLEGCCKSKREKDCSCLDGALKDIPEIEPWAIDLKLEIDNLVRDSFGREITEEERKEALKKLGAMVGGPCFFARELVSSSIREFQKKGEEKDGERVVLKSIGEGASTKYGSVR